MNSTTAKPHPVFDATNIMIMSSLSSFVTRYRPELELLWTLTICTPFLARTYSYLSPTITRARSYPYPSMLLHILLPPLIILRYHARYAATRTWPQPDFTDLVLFTLFNASSFLLEVSRSPSSYTTPPIRTGFHAAVLIHAALFFSSWLSGRDAGLFRAAVKLLNWFASFRAAEKLLPKIDARLSEVKSFATRFEMTMLLSGCWGMWEAGVPGGVPWFLGAIAGFMVLERGVAEAVYR